MLYRGSIFWLVGWSILVANNHANRMTRLEDQFILIALQPNCAVFLGYK